MKLPWRGLTGGGGRQPQTGKRWSRVGQDTRRLPGLTRIQGCWGRLTLGRRAPAPRLALDRTLGHGGQRTDVVHFLALAISTPDALRHLGERVKSRAPAGAANYQAPGQSGERKA